MAVPFDPQRLEVTGTAVPMVEGVLQPAFSGAAQYSISSTGSLVYVPESVRATQRSLVWVSRNGAEKPLPAPAGAYRIPRLSPDGRRVAVVLEEPEPQVWLYDLARETLTRLTFEGDVNQNPAWTPDGRRVAFSSTVGPSWQLADGSRGRESLTPKGQSSTPTFFSPDGQFLALNRIGPATGFDIWVLRLADRKVQPFLQTRPSTNTRPLFPPTDVGWPMPRMHPATRRSTCSLIPAQEGNGKFRRMAGRSRFGIATGENCSTAMETR